MFIVTAEGDDFANGDTDTTHEVVGVFDNAVDAMTFCKMHRRHNTADLLVTHWPKGLMNDIEMEYNGEAETYAG